MNILFASRPPTLPSVVPSTTMWTYAAAVCALACCLQVRSAAVSPSAATLQESDARYWLENGKRMVEEKKKIQLRTNTAKNLIIFMGDGMSLTTLTAARIYQGQLRNTTGESDHLSFEQFPFTGISKTYCVDKQVPDSACTATAYLCGIKNNMATIGVTSKVLLSDCPASVSEENRVTSLLQWAQWAGKATGIVTTTRVTHASPAGAFAHTAHRDWESDGDMLTMSAGKTNVTQCEDIAKQLITRDPGRNFKVIMGGGIDKFTMKGTNSTGERSDEDLLLNWQNDKKTRFGDKVAKYVKNREELLNTDMSKVDFILGLFHRSHMDYRLKADAGAQPTLREMTDAAVRLLRKEPNGFALFVEGGLIDRAHHKTTARLALDETVELAKAVAGAAELTGEDDTLIVVTSDHAHTMSMAGYPNRGENVLGSSGKPADDGVPYTTLSYANGPKTPYDKGGSQCRRANVTGDDFGNVDYQYPSLVDMKLETHGGDDVMVFARGPWSHLFTGNFEQSEIPLAMAAAAGISTEPPSSGSGSGAPANIRERAATIAAAIALSGATGVLRRDLS